MAARFRVRFGLVGLLGFVAACALLMWFFRETDPAARLAKGLRSENAEVRTTAMNQLRIMGPSAVPALTAELKGGSALGREMSAWVLTSYGSHSAPAVPALIQALKDPKSEVRAMAALAIGKIGPESTRDAIPALIEALGDKAFDVRQNAADTLAEYGSDAKPAIPALIAAMKKPGAVDTEDILPRQSASRTLAILGTESADELLPLLASDDEVLQGLCVDVLSKMGREIVPKLVAELSNEKAQSRWRAAQILGRMGSASEPAVPDLKKATQDSDEMVRARAAEALWKVAKDGETATPVLIAVVKDSAGAAQLVAISALREMGTAAEPAVATFIDSLKAENVDVRLQAAVALGRFGKSDSNVVAALTEALQDKDAGVRGDVVASLNGIGANAAQAIPILKKMGEDEINVRVRKAAGGAAKAIESGGGGEGRPRRKNQ